MKIETGYEEMEWQQYMDSRSQTSSLFGRYMQPFQWEQSVMIGPPGICVMGICNDVQWPITWCAKHARQKP